MNISETIWDSMSVDQQIVYITAYAAVFNDAISINDIARKLPFNPGDEIKECVSRLVEVNILAEKNGFVALPHLRYKLDQKETACIRASELIEKNRNVLQWIGRLPFIRFVGISGSLCVGNLAETPHKKVDLDVFLITSSQKIWIVGFFMALYRNVVSAFGGSFFCFNHIWDESDLSIYNRNFYTANEVFNIIPISGTATYHKFLYANRWASFYFPSFFAGLTEPLMSEHFKRGKYVNRLFYVLFTAFRCIKKRSLKPLKTISFQFDPFTALNVNRRGASNGGYQLMVQKKFEYTLKKRLTPYYTPEILEQFFSDELSRFFKANSYDTYSLASDQKELHGWKLNYAKYAES